MSTYSSSPVNRSIRTTVSGSRGAGWRWGALYGPAVYGVSAAAVALPATADHLANGSPALVWILTAYAVGVGVGAVTAGRMTDLWGTRPVLLTAAALLTAGAVTCAIASTLTVVVCGRILLAMGSGATMAVALTATAGLPAARRPTALAAFGACLAGFSATAPLAGAMATHWSWQVALALPALSIAAVPACLPLTTRMPRQAPVDWAGVGLVTATATGLLLLAQSAAQRPDTVTAGIAAVTATLTASLVVHARKHTNGFLPPATLSAAWFWFAAATGGCVYGGLFATLYAAPHLLARQDYTTTDIGVLLLPGAVIGALVARSTVRAARRQPPRRVLAVVSLVLAAGLAYAAADPRPWVLAATSTAAFTAAAVAQTLLTAYVSGRTGPRDGGGAIGLFILATFLGGAFGAAICAAHWDTARPAVSLAATAALPAVGALTACRLQ
ncbi:MFS transporter [Micromonospora craterilacus]|uniref:MFS transporter n=1 Tax=Micromonospora craterilacus TaxID=1655439 RepID=A0A2W2F1H8_9ACTN|nr:MFS transporter [Micromonospora craterilacus]PZG22155.1 MFS transporter [Micromonospora craterilacus]